MTSSPQSNPTSDNPSVLAPTLSSSGRYSWYHPIFSPEHGVYVVLVVSFLTGVAAAQQWTLASTLALISAFCGFQAEHPFVLQIKQRKSWKPRFLVWGSLYAVISLGIAGYLALQTPMVLWLCLGAIATFAIDAISVFYRQQKSFANELLTFAAVCLTAPLAYMATTGMWTMSILGLWLLNTLFFSSAIFTVKLRKPRTASRLPGSIYHGVASVIIVGLWGLGWVSTVGAIAFSLAVVKFSVIGWQRDWYQTTPIQNVAFVETFSSLLFLSLTAVSLLPAHLPPAG